MRSARPSIHSQDAAPPARGTLAAVSVALSLLAAVPAVAHDAPGAHSAQPTKGEITLSSQPRTYVTANEAGMVIAIDRETGKARPLTLDERQRLVDGIRQLISQSTDGLVQVRHADGSVSMDLQGRFQSFMLAKREDDGSLSQACVDSPDDAAAFFEIDPALVSGLQKAARRVLPKQLETK